MKKRLKPKLSISQIVIMNFGFMGIQYSFGLQQSAINPLYTYLGADPEQLPILNLAGPVTGLVIQPIIGALSDRTWSPTWGRRKPYFLIGAIFCSLALFAFPFSSEIWMAAGLLWILDAANNTAMEPYRAFVADTLDEEQQPTGFLAQSFFTGLGITLANFSLYFLQKGFKTNMSITNEIPKWVYGSFFIGAVVSFFSVWLSTQKLKETPPDREELARLRAQKLTIWTPFQEIFEAISAMPRTLWQLALVYLFQWYALFIYWQYISLSLARSIWHSGPKSKGYDAAVGWTGILNGSYNIVTFLCAFFLVTLARRHGAKWVHAGSIALAAIGLMFLSQADTKFLSLLPMIGMGIAWASIMGVPYILVIPSIPENKYGVYMGIVNMMIVIPMFIQTLTFKYVYNSVLGAKPTHAIFFAGILLLLAALLTLRIREVKSIRVRH